MNNTRHVGFAAGRRVMQLGSVSDVKLFFNCIPHVALLHQGKPWNLMLDRLYRRYLRPEDLEPSLELMKLIKSWAGSQSSSFVDWGGFIVGESGLNRNANNLGQVFSKFFSFFETGVNSAMYHANEGGNGAPSVVRLVISDMGDFLKYEKERPLAEYDRLAGNATPFWDLPYSELDRLR